MAKQRRHCSIGRVDCANIANRAGGLVMSVLAAFVACDNRETGAGSRPPDGSGTGAASGSGAASGAAISCNPSGGGCLCIAGDAQPGQLTTCSPASVVETDAERGVCCVAQALCTCTRYTCRSDPASTFCQCGSTLALAGVTLGAPAAECPPPASGQKCCFSQDNASCICSRLACAAEESEVPNCSAVAAGACPGGEDITACR
jgi:hypothetical protein